MLIVETIYTTPYKNYRYTIEIKVGQRSRENKCDDWDFDRIIELNELTQQAQLRRRDSST